MIEENYINNHKNGIIFNNSNINETNNSIKIVTNDDFDKFPNVLINPMTMKPSINMITPISSSPNTSPPILRNSFSSFSNNSNLQNQNAEMDCYFKSRINNAINSCDDSNEQIMKKIILNSTHYWSKYALSNNNIPEKLILKLKYKYSPKSTFSDLKNEDKRKYSLLNDIKDKDNNSLFEIYMISITKKVLGSAHYDEDGVDNNKLIMNNDCIKEEEIEIDTWINDKNQICNEFTGLEVCLLDELLMDHNENIEDIELFNENLGPIFEEYVECVDKSVSSLIYWYSTVSIIFWPKSLHYQLKLSINFNSKLTELQSRKFEIETQDFNSIVEKQKEALKYEETLNKTIRYALLKFSTLNDIDIKILCELVTNRNNALSILNAMRINNIYSTMRADSICILVTNFPWQVLEKDIIALIADSIINPNFISYSLHLLDLLAKQIEFESYNNLVIKFADIILRTVPVITVQNFNFPVSSILTMKTLLCFIELFVNNECLLENNMALHFFNKLSPSLNLKDFNYIVSTLDVKNSTSQLPDKVKISRNKCIIQLKILSLAQCELEMFNPIIDVVNMIHNVLFTNEVSLFKRLVLILNSINMNIFHAIFSHPIMHQAIQYDPNHPLRVVLKYRCDLFSRNDLLFQDPNHIVFIVNLIVWLQCNEALKLIVSQLSNPSLSHVIYALFDDPSIKALVQSDENHILRKLLIQMADLLLKSNELPDPLSWENTSISLPDRPEIQKFLRSDARTIRMDGFSGINEAIEFVEPPKSMNWSDFSVRPTFGGSGKKSYVMFEKTGDLYIQKKNVYDHNLVEISKLKRLIASFGANPINNVYPTFPIPLNFQNIVGNPLVNPLDNPLSNPLDNPLVNPIVNPLVNPLGNLPVPYLNQESITPSSFLLPQISNNGMPYYSHVQNFTEPQPKRPKMDRFNLGALSIDSDDIHNQIEFINIANLQQQQQNPV